MQLPHYISKNIPAYCLLQIVLLAGIGTSGLHGQTEGDFLENEGGGRISGNLELNSNFFLRDSLIGAANIPQYDRQLYGADAWMNLTYSNWGFDFGLRFDVFNNSNLLNPSDSYTDQGIGRWFVQTKVEKLGITAGYIYDQIGSGLIFRAYEERPLAIDNALIGLRLTYDLGENWQVKGFTGRQKQQFDVYGSIIKGLAIEGFVTKQLRNKKTLTLAPGIGVMNRTLDDLSMDALVSTLNTYTVEDAFVPNYNVYAFSGYNTLTYGKFSWYIEGAYKTTDAVNDPFGTFIVDSTIVVGDKFVNRTGSVIYTSLGIAGKGFGLTVEGRRTDNFTLRTRPQEQLNRGMISFQPSLARINTYRLTARYSPATQELGEYALQADLKYSPSRDLAFNFNYTNLSDLEGGGLYGELYTEVTIKKRRLWTLIAGAQLQSYNQEVYEFKPGVPTVETITPFVDFQYKIGRKRAVRFEAQYMNVGEEVKSGDKHDYGDWVFALVEYSMAPHWTLTASDMFNISPGKNSPRDASGEQQSLHFPRFDVYYTHRSNRFSLSFVKQVEGIVCAGGICRLEPAFSGVKMTVNSSF